MKKDEKYFQNISHRERAIFEGAITMGAMFHQFVGTPVNKKNVESLETAIKEAMELQPCIDQVEVKIDLEIISDIPSEYEYISLTGEMLDVTVVSSYRDKKAVSRMHYIEELKYPLMYVKKVD
ncbi:MAG TPA: dihydroneopterin aldolase family protein [Methanobacteriaceae archaeon]|nr:dihydroneopterin aldolase family protein [Methanobacteriaceae archaeon]